MEQLLEVTREQTFIRVAEVWVPEAGSLRLAGSDFGDMSHFAEASQAVRFSPGEGLPGRAWAEGRPIVMGTTESAGFARSGAAAKAGLTCAVAVPIFAGSDLKAILVMMCGTDARHAGAIEIWEDVYDKLQLADGYYGRADNFAAVSRGMSFQHGEGLPGSVWAANTPKLMCDLGRTSAFLRSREAAEIGLTNGIGIPVPVPGDKRYVLVLLSSPETPIARRFELWDARSADSDGERQAVLVDGICEREGGLWPKEFRPVDQPSARPWQGPIGRVLASGLPQVETSAAGLPAGYRHMIALPVHRGPRLAHIVAWYL